MTEIIKGPNKQLQVMCEPFDFANPPMDPVQLFETLKQTMIENKGIGLAAPQIGIPYRVFVVGEPSDPDNIFGVFNPFITSTLDSEEIQYEEGCLSFPGLFIKIKRPSAIRVRYTNQHGVTNAIKFDGMTARIFQHEYDHLDGICMVNRADRYHLDVARKNKKLLDRKRKKNMKEQAAKPQNSRPLTVDEKEELKKGLMTILNDVEFGTPTIKMGPPPDKKAEVKDNEDS